MSLINGMLTDLEKRRGGSLRNVDRALDGLRPAASTEQDPSARWRMAAIAALLTIVLAAGLATYRLVVRPPTEPSAEPAPAAAPAAVAAPPPPAVPVLLTDEAPAATLPQTPSVPEADSTPAPQIAADTTPATPPAASDLAAVDQQADEDAGPLAANATQGRAEPVAEPATAGAAPDDASESGAPDATTHWSPPPARLSVEQLAVEAISGGRLDDAENLLREGLSTNPEDTGLRLLLGRTLLQRGDAAGAVAELRSIATGAPAEDPELHTLLAAAEQRAGRHRDASARYRALLQARPDAGALLVGLGISLSALGDRDDAHAAFARALGDPSLPTALRDFSTRQINEFEGRHP